MNDNITHELQSWEEVSRYAEWSSILIGNGFSQNIWKRFGYTSLYEQARELNGASLSPDDITLFDRLQTTNFERVLSALSTSITVNNALGREANYLQERYENIKGALINAVHAVHIPFHLISNEKLDIVKTELSNYGSVYIVNYDLICYWAIMREPGKFRDFFFSSAKFDISNTDVWGDRTSIHFLHGGLHLYRKPTGETIKRRAEAGKNLLELFGTEFEGAVPLFVSEGSFEDKLASISRSDYLSFLFNKFLQDKSPIVVFGSSLGNADRHIVNILNSKRQREIAISIKNDGDIRQKKASLIEALPNVRLYFFDAETHPLGSHELRVVEDE
jgi:hypothetical protein